jgi:hypothetical protein
MTAHEITNSLSRCVGHKRMDGVSHPLHFDLRKGMPAIKGQNKSVVRQ